MTDLEILAAWSLVVGFFMPVAVAFIQRQTWGDVPRAIVAFLCCLAAGFGTAYFTYYLSWSHFAISFVLVLVSAISTYKGFWQKTGVASWVEGLTNRGKK